MPPIVWNYIRRQATERMKTRILQDEKGATHIEWELDDVTPRMLNWFWCNLEKCDLLWHPNQHNNFEWFVSIGELGTPLKSIHIAPQTWSDGKAIRPYIRMEPLTDVPDEIKAYIKYDHVVIVGGISILGDNVKRDDPVLGYRVHQWQKSDSGVVGMSTAIEVRENEASDGIVWAEHAAEEIANWEVFLPDLYRLYKVIKRRDICPYYSFRVNGTGKDAVYVEL